MHTDSTERTETGGSNGSSGPLVLSSHLAVGGLSLVAGVLLGGWLAFETVYWEGFKSLVEGSSVVVPLAVGLCLLALVTSLAATYQQAAPRVAPSERRD